jgi:hypothetical protein
MKTFTFIKLRNLFFFFSISFTLAFVQVNLAYSADIFDESKTETLSLDERIKALESSIKIESPSATNNTQKDDRTRRLKFQNSISGQLDASTLEQEVHDLKSDIIELNKELALLEQDILTPVSSQTALFLSIDKGSFFKLDGLKVEINGEVVEHHLYTKQEIDALTKGAIQRVYTANLAPGEHELVVILSGYSIDGRDVKKAANYKFYKPSSKKYIQLAIIDNLEKQKVDFEFSEWQ